MFFLFYENEKIQKLLIVLKRVLLKRDTHHNVYHRFLCREGKNMNILFCRYYHWT